MVTDKNRTCPQKGIWLISTTPTVFMSYIRKIVEINLNTRLIHCIEQQSIFLTNPFGFHGTYHASAFDRISTRTADIYSASSNKNIWMLSFSISTRILERSHTLTTEYYDHATTVFLCLLQNS